MEGVQCLMSHDWKGDTMSRSIFIAAVLLCPSFRAAAAPPAENYLFRLQDTIVRTRSNLAAVTNSAGKAAAEYLTGGISGPQGGRPTSFPKPAAALAV
jgi:hypothetical protein